MSKALFLLKISQEGFTLNALGSSFSKHTNDDRGVPECWVLVEDGAKHYPKGSWDSDEQIKWEQPNA